MSTRVRCLSVLRALLMEICHQNMYNYIHLVSNMCTVMSETSGHFCLNGSASEWQVRTLAVGSVSRQEVFLLHFTNVGRRGHTATGEQCGMLEGSGDVSWSLHMQLCVERVSK